MVYGSIEHPVKDHEYHSVQENLDPPEIARFIYGIQESAEYILSDLGHILLSGTQTVIGYIGDEHVDLVDSSDRSIHIHQNSLISLLSECLAEI